MSFREDSEAPSDAEASPFQKPLMDTLEESARDVDRQGQD
jgi:hypothetical protein